MNAYAKCLSPVLTVAAVMLVPAGLSAAQQPATSPPTDTSAPPCPTGDTQRASHPRPDEAPQPPAPPATPLDGAPQPPASPAAPPDHVPQPAAADTGSARNAACAPADITVPAPSPPSCAHPSDGADAVTSAVQPGSVPLGPPCRPTACRSGAPDDQGSDPEQSGDGTQDDGSDANDAGDDTGSGTAVIPNANVASPDCQVAVCALADASVHPPRAPKALMRASRRSDPPAARAPSSPQAGHRHHLAYRAAAAMLLPAPEPTPAAQVPAYLLLLVPMAALAPALARRLRRVLQR